MRPKRPSRHSLALRALLWLWAVVGLLLVTIFVIPTWRAQTLFRLWSLGGWQLESVWRYGFLHSGPASVDLLLKKVQGPNPLVFQTLIDAPDSSLDRLWQWIAISSNPGTKAYLENVLKSCRAPGLLDSIRQRSSDPEPQIRQVARKLSIEILKESDLQWLNDPDPHLRASLISYFVQEDVVRRALEDVEVVRQEVLYLALQANEKGSKTRKMFDEPIQQKLGELLQSSDPQTLSLLYEWIGYQNVSNEIVAQIGNHLSAPNAQVRHQAALTLARLGRQEYAPKIWQMAFEDDQILVQVSAWQALVDLAPQSVLPQLRFFLAQASQEDKEVVLKALKVLEVIGTREDLDLLQPFLTGYDYDLGQLAKRVAKKLRQKS